MSCLNSYAQRGVLRVVRRRRSGCWPGRRSSRRAPSARAMARSMIASVSGLTPKLPARQTPMRAPCRACGVQELGVVGVHVPASGRSSPDRLGSTPVIAPSTTAASVTLRVIGPAVSCSAEIGTMPERLASPSVGLMPTSPFCAGRAHDRPVGLGADRDRGQVGGRRDAGAGTRAARVAIERVRHVGLAAHAAPAARRTASSGSSPIRRGSSCR